MGVFDSFLKNKNIIDESNKINHKTLAFVISMYKIFVSNGSEQVSEDCVKFMFYLVEDYKLQNFAHFFEVIFFSEHGSNLLKNHDKYLKSLTEKEFEELLFILIKLSLMDKKLTNSELVQIKLICSSFNHSRDILKETVSELLDSHLTQKSDDDDYIRFLSYMETFEYATKKADNGELNDALLLNCTLLAQLKKEKLLFGRLIENKIYVEGSEAIPLGNIYFNRGQDYEALGRKTEALNDFIMATTIDTEIQNPLFFHHAGCLMFELGEHTKCIKYFDKAIDLDEISSSESYYMRAGAYFSDKCEKQNVNEGLKDLKKYLELNPEDLKAKNLLQNLKQSNE